MKTSVDWLGLSLATILCVLALYIIGWIPTYPPILIKEGFMASAGSGVMGPPSKIKCRKVGLNATAVPSLTQSGGNTWLCADATNATQLIGGDKTLQMAYISRNDTVCVAQDADGTIYTCMDPSLDPYDESPSNEYDNYTTSCNAYYAKYYDISNALTTLLKMKETILGNQESLQSSKTILDTMNTGYKCVNRATMDLKHKTICNAIVLAITAITSDVAKASDLKDILLKSIQPALDSRTGLIRTLREYHCDFVLPTI